MIEYTLITETIEPWDDQDDMPEPEYDLSNHSEDSFRDMVRVLERGYDCATSDGRSVYAYDAEQNYRTGVFSRDSLHAGEDAFSARWFARAVRYVAAKQRRRG